MTLVDTSIWVGHLRAGVAPLKTLLMDGLVMTHPFIVGELACGHLKNRLQFFSLLKMLPQGQVAEHEEVLRLVHDRRLMGCGLGWVDVHLLASAMITRVPLWTADKALRKAAQELGVAFTPV